MADLGRWLGGHYRVPGNAATPPESPTSAEDDEGIDDAIDDELTRR
jgi:endogenous inhibitor of DNA gyrase (YacG/DUF329 family)